MSVDMDANHGTHREQDMGETIGSMLTGLAALRTQLPVATARASGSAPSSSPLSFAEQLDASFRSRAERLGLDLPVAAPAADPAGGGDDVDAIWKRVQLQSAAIHGPGDALMQAVGEAGDARWEQRHGRGDRDLFDM